MQTPSGFSIALHRQKPKSIPWNLSSPWIACPMNLELLEGLQCSIGKFDRVALQTAAAIAGGFSWHGWF
jgi:hypothetical protein